MTSVVIIGAGPYGLSLAAHLGVAGVDFRIFGKPMANWREKMPSGMFLKSEGFASNLYEPQQSYTLRKFCELKGIPYQDTGLPVSLATFVSYGLHFQRLFVPDLDETDVEKIERRGGGYLVHPSRGNPIAADQVVVATGISHFQHVPRVFEGLTREYVSHSSDWSDLSSFKGRDVVVVGAGASAVDSAALLHEAGARVQLVARAQTIRFNSRPSIDRTLADRLRSPASKLGPGWKNLFYEKSPLAFYFFPWNVRRHEVRCHLGPAPGWFVRERAEGRFPMLLGAAPIAASTIGGRVHLKVELTGGTVRTIECDHIISATGYKVDVRRLPFLGEGLVRELETVDNTPRLSLSFESSVPGLYFTGLAAASHFGPVMRFACGAESSVPRLSRHLIRSSARIATRAGAGGDVNASRNRLQRPPS